MKNKVMHYPLVIISSVLLCGLVSAESIFNSNNVTSNSLDTPLISSAPQQKPVKQEVEDVGDYYYLNTGERKSFFRKKNLLLLIPKEGVFTVSEMAGQVEANFNDQVEVIKGHSFSGLTMVRIQSEQADINQLTTALESSISDVEFVSPVFTSDIAQGEAAILPRIVVRLDPMITPSKLLNEAELNNRLLLSSALVDAKQEYEFSIDSYKNIAEIFTLSRQIMALPYVKWAEPSMVVPAINLFTPNDSLYLDQWHLNNTGQNGGLADADIDAPEGWDLSKGDGTVVAIFDDGVEVDHPDLAIWLNPEETGGGKESNGIDDDGNGYIDDYQGWDFGGSDNDPSPATSTDNHGTAVAGVAAAKGNNSLGVTGSAMNAKILPVKSGSMSCTEWGNAMRYAGKYSDVVNNSWGISSCESSLNSAINDVVSGNISGARRGNKGTPVLFATGNSAGGWRQFGLSGFQTGSTYTFTWEFSKDTSVSEGFDTVWLDNISWPGGTISNFESDTLGGLPSGFTGSGNANWSVINDGVHSKGATGNSVKAGAITHSQISQLNTTRAVGTGTLYYWVWVSSELSWDYFNFYVGGTLYHSYTPGQYSGHENEVGYPASNPDTIAVGGSQDGGPGAVEERTYYSQFGPEVDVVSPTSGGYQGTTTTDRTGIDGYDTLSDYTDGFGGTSSATPLTAGIVADILAYRPELTALQLRNVLRNGAEQIGPYSYPEGRNNYYGHGRSNLFQSLQLAEVVSLQGDVVKRSEIAKPILLKKYGVSYNPPMLSVQPFTDVGTNDFNAAWIAQLADDGITEGCTLNEYCPDAVVTKEMLAKMLLKAKLGSAYNPIGSAGSIFLDVSAADFNSKWIEDLSILGISEGCKSGYYCPEEVVTLESFEKMLNKTFP